MLRDTALFELLLSVPTLDRDAFADALLGIDPPPPDVADLPRGAVPYLPCGVDEILATVRELPVRRGDALLDLGSGLGRVAILVHLLSGARTSGIELQEHLVRGARERCAALALDRDVSFLHADALHAPLDGSIFFLYAPFNGDMLRRVLHRLEEVARRRRIVLCAVDLELPGARWLAPRKTSSLALTLYESFEPWG